MDINIGDFLIRFFWGIIGFFQGLANFLAIELTLPTWLFEFIQSIFPDLTIPTSISAWILLSTGGAAIAFAISIYYIIKGAI